MSDLSTASDLPMVKKGEKAVFEHSHQRSFHVPDDWRIHRLIKNAYIESEQDSVFLGKYLKLSYRVKITKKLVKSPATNDCDKFKVSLVLFFNYHPVLLMSSWKVGGDKEKHFRVFTLKTRKNRNELIVTQDLYEVFDKIFGTELVLRFVQLDERIKAYVQGANPIFDLLGKVTSRHYKTDSAEDFIVQVKDTWKHLMGSALVKFQLTSYRQAVGDEEDDDEVDSSDWWFVESSEGDKFFLDMDRLMEMSNVASMIVHRDESVEKVLQLNVPTASTKMFLKYMYIMYFSPDMLQRIKQDPLIAVDLLYIADFYHIEGLYDWAQALFCLNAIRQNKFSDLIQHYIAAVRHKIHWARFVLQAVIVPLIDANEKEFYGGEGPCVQLRTSLPEAFDELEWFLRKNFFTGRFQTDKDIFTDNNQLEDGFYEMIMRPIQHHL